MTATIGIDGDDVGKVVVTGLRAAVANNELVLNIHGEMTVAGTARKPQRAAAATR